MIFQAFKNVWLCMCRCGVVLCTLTLLFCWFASKLFNLQLFVIFSIAIHRFAGDEVLL